jgi:hypothetical protein
MFQLRTAGCSGTIIEMMMMRRRRRRNMIITIKRMIKRFKRFICLYQCTYFSRLFAEYIDFAVYC